MLVKRGCLLTLLLSFIPLSRTMSQKRARFNDKVAGMKKASGAGGGVGKSAKKRSRSAAPSYRPRRSGVEAMAVDIASTTSAVTSAGPVTCLNATQEGSGMWNRTGRKIRLISAYINGVFTPKTGAAATAVAEYARVIMFYDRQSNGTLPTLAMLLEAKNQAGTLTNTVYDGLNLDNRDRFSVLADHRVLLPPLGTANSPVQIGGGSDGGSFSRFTRLNGLETVYNSTANPATYAQIATGGLFVMVVGETGVNTYDFKWSSRVKFEA